VLIGGTVCVIYQIGVHPRSFRSAFQMPYVIVIFVFKICGVKWLFVWLHIGGIVNRNCLRFIVFNATFNNISVISWRSVLLVEDTGVSGENHQSVASH